MNDKKQTAPRADTGTAGDETAIGQPHSNTNSPPVQGRVVWPVLNFTAFTPSVTSETRRRWVRAMLAGGQ